MRGKPRLAKLYQKVPTPHLRQLGWYDPQIFNPRVTIVGAGGIGSWTAMALAKLGVREFIVYDMDKVEEHNLGSTPYHHEELGKKKVRALKPIIERFGFGVKFRGISKRYEGGPLPKTDVLISAVDSMEGRRLLFKEAVKQKIPFFIDGRIGGENLRVYSIRPTKAPDRKFYRLTTKKSIQIAPLPCSAQQCIDIGLAVSSLITRAFRNWIAVEEYIPEVIAKISHLQLVSSPMKESEARRKWRAEIQAQRKRYEDEAARMGQQPATT